MYYSPRQLQEDAPDGLLWKGRVEALPLVDVVAQVAVGRVLHHHAQLAAVEEGLVVADLCVCVCVGYRFTPSLSSQLTARAPNKAN